MGPTRSKESGRSPGTGRESRRTSSEPYIKRHQRRPSTTASFDESRSDEDVQFVEDLGPTSQQKSHTHPGSSRSQRESVKDKSKAESKGKGKIL